MTTLDYATSEVAVSFDPLLDKRYQRTRLGRDVADFLAWKEIGGAAPRTLDQNERDLARGCLMFPDVPFDEWTDTHLLHVAKAFKPKERRTRMACYSKFFQWGRLTKRIRENPMETLPKFKRPPQPFIEVFTDDEVTALCSLPARDGALMAILFDIGIRSGEARVLQLRQVGPEVIRIRGKGSKKREIPATVGLLQKVNELAIIEGLSANDYLWWTRPGGGTVISRDRPIGEGSIKRWWRNCLEEAGVDYRNLHVTRHTFATRWLRRGGRITTLSTVMGHASIATTYSYYGHLDNRDLIADFELVAREGS